MNAGRRGIVLQLIGRSISMFPVKRFFFSISVVLFLMGAFAPSVRAEANVEDVASFRGAQVTGVTVTDKGRIFVNFPRWRDHIPCSVAEVRKDGSYTPYPDEKTNLWEKGAPGDGDAFVCVQSVVADGDRLYVIDTKNPMIGKTVAVPTLYVYDLNTDKLVRKYPLAESTKPGSYVNDLRVDREHGKIYFTDSNEPGLIVLDMKSGENYRMLDNHPYTTAEQDHITVNGKRHDGKVHSDGIALDRKNNILYFHALTGKTLYGIPTSQLIDRRVDEGKISSMKTPFPDGMIMDDRGNLYMGDLEKGRIVYLTPDRKEIRVLASGDGISWPDTFSIHDGYLYFTNSRIQEATGDISNMEFTLKRVKLPE